MKVSFIHQDPGYSVQRHPKNPFSCHPPRIPILTPSLSPSLSLSVPIFLFSAAVKTCVENGTLVHGSLLVVDETKLENVCTFLFPRRLTPWITRSRESTGLLELNLDADGIAFGGGGPD